MLYNFGVPYLIDGHNLIPKVGLRLDSPDDEMQLVNKLQDFCRVQRKQVEVYFDGAPPGQAGMRKLGSVKVYFVRMGATADAAILNRLKRLGRSARNWHVVSSDRQVQAEARSAHAQVLSSEAFAGMMSQPAKSQTTGLRAEREVTPEEVHEWLKLFEMKRHGRE